MLDAGGDDRLTHGGRDHELRPSGNGGLGIFGLEHGAYPRDHGLAHGRAGCHDRVNGALAGEREFQHGYAAGHQGAGRLDSVRVIVQADDGDDLVLEDLFKN